MRKVLCAIALAIPVAVLTLAPADSVSPRAKPLHDHAIGYHAAFLSEEFRVASEKKKRQRGLGVLRSLSRITPIDIL